jgi:hypothetical protein
MNSELGHTTWHIYYLHWVKDCTKVRDKVLLERTVAALEDAASILPQEVINKGPRPEPIYHNQWDYYDDINWLSRGCDYNYSMVVDVFKCLMRNLFKGFIFSYDELVAHDIHRGRYADTECFWDPSDKSLWLKLNTKVECGYSLPSVGLLFSSTFHDFRPRPRSRVSVLRDRSPRLILRTKVTSWFKIVEVSRGLASNVEKAMKIKNPSMGDLRNRICGGRRKVHRVMTPVTLGYSEPPELA